MKDVDLLAAACELKEERSFHQLKPGRRRRAAIDVIAILDPLEDYRSNEASDHLARENWLGRTLPKAFDDARLLTYRRTQPVVLDRGSEIDIGAFANQFLTVLSGLRNQTNTADTPFIILVHNSSGVDMLSAFVFSLLTALSHSFFGLSANARGIVCVEATQPKQGFPYCISPSQSMDDSGNILFHDKFGTLLVQHGNRLPVTVFLDDKLQFEPKQEQCLNPYLWKLVKPHIKSASLVFTPLYGKPYPISPASTGRVLGEIRKYVTQSIEPSFTGVEEAYFRRWLFPSRALFHHQAPHVVNGSGDWLFRHESYRSWMCSEHNDLLWITGKPGSGKSTLIKLLRDSIRHKDEPSIAASIMFDFHYVLEHERDSAKGMLLRVLLYQILESVPSLLPRLCQTLGPLSSLPERPEDWDVNYYQIYLEAALSAVTDKATVFLLIDGLDECDPDVQDDVMACLSLIYQRPRFNKKIRIMITSRWTSSMQRIQEKWHTGIRYLEMQNSQDIATFCSTMLLSKRTSLGTITEHHSSCVQWRDSVEELVESIVTKADGVFLWVRLVVDLLLNDYPAQQYPSYGTKVWQEAVQELPTGLESLYENLVERIPTQLRSASDLLFMWCSHTAQPLEEVELQSLIKSNDKELKLESAWRNISSDDFASLLRRMTYGLVEVVSDPRSYTNTVRFIHATVKDFFVQATSHLVAVQTGSSQDPIGLMHTAMAKTCLLHIGETFCDGTTTVDPLLNYSVLHWHFHARMGEQLAVSQDYLIDVFESRSWKNASIWLERYKTTHDPCLRSTKVQSLLHVAAQHGLISALKALSSRDPARVSWDSKDFRGRTALHHAVAQGHTDVVRFLLEHGASVDMEDTQNIAPLQSASREGHTTIVMELLAVGANTSAKDVTGRTAIHHAVRAGHMETVKVLIENSADLEAKDLQGHSVLTLATASGNEELAMFLLEQYASTWSATVIGVALTIAAGLGLQALSRSLLRAGKFDDPDDVFLQQAFIASVIAGSEDLLLLFLGLGCHPDLHDHRYGQSALSIAAASGHDRLVCILLQHGAHANIRDIRTGITPVMHGISRGYPAVVNLLVDFGAEPEMPKGSDDPVEDGWIYRFLLAMIREHPSGNNRRSNNRKGTDSSAESVAGSSTNGHDSQSSFGKSRKRSRAEQDMEGDEGGSDDEVVAQKKSRHDKSSDAQIMCPFHRMHPDMHTCPPFLKVARLKEHIHRTHRKVFCVHCWRIFSDDAAVAVHHKTEPCKERDRTDFSGGISESQAKELKSRVGVSKLSETQHWERVFKIVFPNFEGRLPSSTYYNTSNTIVEAIREIFRDPGLRQVLEPIVGRQQWERVRNLFIAFAGNQRLAQPHQNSGGIPMNNFPPGSDQCARVSSSCQQPLAIAHHPANVNEFQGLFPVSQQLQGNQSWPSLNPVFEAPNLQHAYMQPSHRPANSDSGFGSTVREPQDRGVYMFDNADAEGTAGSSELGQAQTLPYHTNVNNMGSMYMSPNTWNPEVQEPWDQDNGESASGHTMNVP